jgi:hypothetical protein
MAVQMLRVLTSIRRCWRPATIAATTRSGSPSACQRQGAVTGGWSEGQGRADAAAGSGA